MAASTEGERLTAIEAGLQHIMAVLEEMKAQIDNMRYVAPDMCAMQHKFYDAQIANFRHDIDMVRKEINGVGMRLDEMRKAWAGRLWSIAIPVLAAIVMSLFSLIKQIKM